VQQRTVPTPPASFGAVTPRPCRAPQPETVACPLLCPRLTRPAWLSPKVARTEILAGLVVALALIPEAISFSILAGSTRGSGCSPPSSSPSPAADRR
jgi:hypothetical protein